ncbi:ATP-dependent Clp protease ATP-binding subunit [Clostridiaceae bacterium M8S5]|nr:ATP-dependent Clp protease ATP-binding subunit [Clostridiaceae bacterium M8S5]
MKLCSICKKNIAVIFTTKVENGKSEMQGLCMECAKKMGLPVLDQMFQQTGMSPEDIENITQQMNGMFNEEDMDMDDATEGNSLGELFGNIFNKKDTSKENINNVKEDKKEKKKEKKRKNLNKYGSNLTKLASQGKVDKIIGRNKEINRVVQILNRRTKNNPVLIGEPGVGKTAIAEGLAVRIFEKEVPEKLQNSEVYLLDMTAVVAGTQFRGQFEGRMKAIINEAKESGNIILVIDEVHNIMGAGEVHGGVMNAANILKPALARGEVQILGATTFEEYRKHIEKDAALERRFQPVPVDEPTVDETIEILKGIKHYYEDYHKVTISDEVINMAAKLSDRYITDRYLPDKAIDLIDEAGSKANLSNKNLNKLRKLKGKLEKLQAEKEIAATEGDFEKSALIKVEEFKVSDEISLLKNNNEYIPLKEEDIAYVIESWTNIPVQKITKEEAKKLLELEEKLHKRVIGQEGAISSLARTIRRTRSGFKKKKKPASFIFVGPTGVGKTELVRSLASELFGSEEALIRIDMSEYMEKHTVSKLIGSPPGYVGYDEGGQLTEKVRRKPYSVILMDEIEKAHPDVFNMLLQILEDGRLTDSQGRTVYFDNTVIVMTSNVGTSLKSASIGFENDSYNVLEAKIRQMLKNTFKPEFLNRVDEIIVFNHLTKEELQQIIQLMINEVKEEALEKEITINVTDTLKSFILEKGYDKKYGARPLRRTIQKYIEDELAEEFLKGNIKPKSSLLIDIVDDNVVIESK